MLAIIDIVLPVFALIAIGAVAARTGYLSDGVGDAVSRFAFFLALPALLFRTVAGSQLPEAIPWGYWLSYYGAVAIVWLATHLVARRLFNAEPREAVIAGLGAIQANTVLVGIPLILKAYGDTAAAPIALLLAINLPLTMAIATLLFESASDTGRSALPGLVRGLATHPILLAIVAGTVANLAGLRLPTLIDAPLALLSAAAIPCALIGLGMSLAKYGIGERLGLVFCVTALKLVVLPAAVFLLGTRIFALPPIYLGAAVIFAAAPIGINTYIFAARYHTGVALTSGAIALSTALAVLSTAAWLWLLGVS